MKMDCEMKNIIARSKKYIRPERERGLRRKGVMEKEGFKFFMKVRNRKSKRRRVGDRAMSQKVIRRNT
jgi:hypothetical protein